MVIGLFAEPGDAAVCLSNLAEADFGPPTVSVVMRTPREAAALAIASGPLTGTPVEALPAKLVALGVPAPAAAAYRDALVNGGVLVAVSAGDAEAAAEEMLRDHGARGIRRVKDA